MDKSVTKARRELLETALQGIADSDLEACKDLKALARYAAADDDAETLSWIKLGISRLMAREISSQAVIQGFQDTDEYVAREMQRVDHARAQRLNDQYWPLGGPAPAPKGSS